LYRVALSPTFGAKFDHMKSYLFLLVFYLCAVSGFAQPLQTLKGTVTDKASQAPIPYATVVLPGTSPLLGTTTDSLGRFSIGNIAVGRYDVKVSSMGYEDALIHEVVLISARQTELTVMLEETTQNLSEITVNADLNKREALNSMATVSARMLSVEEAQRYAGGFDDPARLASAFAGVASNSGINGIIVRGNAPKYLQWKMEGVEIPNPNHFGDLKAFGGGILTGLSSQMLANSDFFSGAFPAEYNNALSGVFDISMRKGNTEKRERTFQIGLIGIDVAQEGPFRKGGQASYLFNYRNSTLALLEPLLPENAEKIKYQDLAFKLHFPTQKAGVFSVWGLGLADGASAKPKTDSLQWFYTDSWQKNDIRQQTGSLGFSHLLFTNASTYIKTTLAATGNLTNWKAQTLNSSLELMPYSQISYNNWNYILSSFVNKKFGARHTNRSGVLVTNMRYSMLLNKAFTEGATPTELVNSSGQSTLLSAYSSSSFRLGHNMIVNAGVNTQYFTLNGHYTIEPRLGLRLGLGRRQSLGLAYGLHSRLENLNYYYNNSLSSGELAVNKQLDFTKAHHLVLSYDLSIGTFLNLRLEPYYQYLFNVPVLSGSSFSFINLQSDWFFAEKLQNSGEGRNYGVDLTLEKYLSRGYYYMFTASIFEATYKGGDGVWRNSRYNRNYVFNLLAGKEWSVGAHRQNVFGINGRVCYQGGNRYSPVDVSATQLTGEVVYNENMAYSGQAPAATTAHLTISYKINKAKRTHEFALKVLNFTGQPDFYGYKYNLKEHTIDKDEDKVTLPNISYKLHF